MSCETLIGAEMTLVLTSLLLARVFQERDKDSRLRQTANMNLYHVTKFSPYFSFSVYCFYIKIKRFMPVLPISIVLDCFYLLIFHSEKFSTDVCCLPFAVNVNLNLSALFSASR